MTRALYHEDAYAAQARARVEAHTPEGGIVLDQTVFYPAGGGQPGDSGRLSWDRSEMTIATAVRGEGDQVVLVPAEPRRLPPVGAHLEQRIDWERRHRHMRMHTALHILSVVIPLPVVGGAVGDGRGRLDFDMGEASADVETLEELLNEAVDRDLPVEEEWITQTALAENPQLIKTVGAMPPRGVDRVRLVRIGTGGDQIDLQPCGGTHVARTGEIGHLRISRIESRGRRTRRVTLTLG
ncbi:alanyl-tRNA editing protein [Roseovarius nubinhibens]|uniref:Alanine--tRNA ligase n=1 Tax=Roseovarius nubinhibens (strain ATCC BAA-591 / DSM 15170 / ISM) TaxID=89187 RepID=A3SMD4_ROSNI|nr:alanyl-tRNA editing protein [Roseovarius nubinhibens]EAP75624.1 Alanyl-transfer RNA synthetase domain protein [Roseovarius nubinhibens ISM]